MAKIKEGMSIIEIVAEMSEGNPGGINVMACLIKTVEDIDPDSATGGFGILCELDYLEIYGQYIWMLYKDLCHEDIVYTHATLRATQLGILDKNVLLLSIKERIPIDCKGLLIKVKEALPRFACGQYQPQN